MEGTPPQASYNGNQEAGSSIVSAPTRPRSNRFVLEDNGDSVECSGKYCRSCAAVLVADCVAICCCPCAVLNFLALAFVKVPWTIGKRCLGLKKNKRKCTKNLVSNCLVVEGDENLRSKCGCKVDERLMLELACAEEKIKSVNGSARFEAEKVWFELYQVGELGFGRVSFSGEIEKEKGH